MQLQCDQEADRVFQAAPSFVQSIELVGKDFIEACHSSQQRMGCSCHCMASIKMRCRGKHIYRADGLLGEGVARGEYWWIEWWSFACLHSGWCAEGRVYLALSKVLSAAISPAGHRYVQLCLRTELGLRQGWELDQGG